MSKHFNAAKEESYYTRMDKTTQVKIDCLGEVSPGQRVLDFGSGPNTGLAEFVTGQGAEYFAVDIDPSVAPIIESVHENAHAVDHLSKLVWRSKFDIIFMGSVAHELASYEPVAVFRHTMLQLVGMLAPTGRLIVRDWPLLNRVDSVNEAVLRVKPGQFETIKAWVDSSRKNASKNWGGSWAEGILLDPVSNTVKGVTPYMWELVYHSVWGKQSLERESHETYLLTDSFVYWLRKAGLEVFDWDEAFDPSYTEHILKRFESPAEHEFQFHQYPTKQVIYFCHKGHRKILRSDCELLGH